MVSYR